MNYIKNNKVFLFLVTVLLLLIAYLAFQLSGWNNAGTSDNTPYEAEEGYTETTFSSLQGTFLEKEQAIKLNWHLIQIDKEIKKVELYQDDTMLQDVSGKRSVTLPLKKYDFKTGNNMFTMVATLEDGNTLTKNVYVYINEVFDFSVKEEILEDKVLYTVSYYYDTRRSVSAPTATISNLPASFNIAYKESKEMSRDNHYVFMNVTYELDYSKVENGTYTVPITWRFIAYHLDFNTSTKIDVNRGE